MARLRLHTLECIQTEDSGEDEAYLKVRGNTVWGGQMNNGWTADLQGLPEIYFYRRASIALYEEDSPDADDYLGRTYAVRSQINQGEIEFFFAEDEANYRLTYEVLP